MSWVDKVKSLPNKIAEGSCESVKVNAKKVAMFLAMGALSYADAQAQNVVGEFNLSTGEVTRYDKPQSMNNGHTVTQYNNQQRGGNVQQGQTYNDGTQTANDEYWATYYRDVAKQKEKNEINAQQQKARDKLMRKAQKVQDATAELKNTAYWTNYNKDVARSSARQTADNVGNFVKLVGNFFEW